jgi:hypothetical protein
MDSDLENLVSPEVAFKIRQTPFRMTILELIKTRHDAMKREMEGIEALLSVIGHDQSLGNLMSTVRL